MTARGVLIECFRAALDAVDARRAVRESLVRRPVPAGPWHVVAIGKAAGAMAQGAVDALGEQLAGGIIVVPPRHLPAGFDAPRHGLLVHVGAHPVPDTSSLAAGQAVIRFVESQPRDARLLFLVSGGASSLAEAPLRGVTLEDLQQINRWAQAADVAIADINAMRRRLSRLKGGGLARLVGDRRAHALLISDVPDDDPRILGSGLLHAPRPDATVACEVPASIRALLERAGPDAAASVPRVPVRFVATLRMACDAAARAAEAVGFHVVRATRRLSGDATMLGPRLVARLRHAPPGTLQVWGGESTVRLPAAPGRGGRNQQLALAAALALETERARDGTTLLAAGTDGIDGRSEDAGAIVDAGTCARGRDGGLDPHASLAAADSGSFLEASGDLLHTGPTLTNVGDLVLGVVPPQGVR